MEEEEEEETTTRLAKDHDRLPGWRGETPLRRRDAEKNEKRTTREKIVWSNSKTRRMMAHLNTLECAAATNVTIASARRANTFFDVEDEEEEGGGREGCRRNALCGVRGRVSLYDPANADEREL